MDRNCFDTLFPEWQIIFPFKISAIKYSQDSLCAVFLEELKVKYTNVFNLDTFSPVKCFIVKFNIKDNAVFIV